MYKTNDFDFDLPQELIAQKPAKSKEHTNMLIFDSNCQMLDKQVIDILQYVKAGDVMVLNDVKVIKAKFNSHIEGRQITIEFNLDQEISSQSQSIKWQALCKPAKKVKTGDILVIANDFKAQIVEKLDNGFIILDFPYNQKDFLEKIELYGKVPLPPYIKREKTNNDDDKNYQTSYAKNGTGVAAPTAGLHFNQKILSLIEQKGVKIVYITLNVGAGTFLPVKSDIITDHKMHYEFFSISYKSAKIINDAKKLGNNIIAVGTTSLRALESATNDKNEIVATATKTDIFIYPPYKFKIVDILITNFHLPKSTLFMLICAFIGKNNANQLYNHAITKKYRFYSYGDCSLLIRNQD